MCGPCPLPYIEKNKIAIDPEKMTRFYPATQLYAEYVITGFLAVLLFWFLYIHAGGPTITWDDLVYLHASLNADQGRGYNRYFHIYFQKLFILLTGDTLSGGRMFWSFIIASTALMIYYIPRFLVAGISRWCGIFGLFIFFTSVKLFTDHNGVTYADVTCMGMLLLGILIYALAETSEGKAKTKYLFLLGFVAFLAVKSKEPAVALFILFPFAITSNDVDKRTVLRRTGIIALGIFSGLLLMMFIDLVYLGDFLFQFRPWKIQAWLGHNIGNYNLNADRPGWPAYLGSTVYFLPFALYLLSPGSVNHRTKQFTAVWLIPLFLLVFFTLAAVSGKFVVVPRFFYPLWPIIAIFAAISLTTGTGNNNRTMFVVCGFIIGLVCAYYLSRFGATGAKTFGWQSEWLFYLSVVYVVASMILLAVLVTVPASSLSTIIILICFVSAIYLPIKHNVNKILDGSVKVDGMTRFEPIMRFEQYLHNLDNSRVFISKEMHTTFNFLGRRDRSSKHLINVFFNKNFKYSKFIFGKNLDPLKNEVFDFIFVTLPEYDKLIKSRSFPKYSAHVDQHRRYAFLCRQEVCAK